jgi:hypothetical protein
MLMFGDASKAADTGAIAQRRRMGDRHERNALRTRASAVRPPEPPTPLYFPQTLTLALKRGTFVARQRNAGLARRIRFRTSVARFLSPSLGSSSSGQPGLRTYPDAARQ